MTEERWLEIERLFNQSIELGSTERQFFLSKIYDPDLRREVETLLAAEESNQGKLAGAVKSAAEDFIHESDASSPFPQRIGNYRIAREIGRGGMGAVYEAFRDDEIKKRVALKIIKRGMDTDEILRRFRKERLILAALEHPFIARLLDGGTTDDGLPFFVMEYVEGFPINVYCEQNRLSTAERLALFRQICAAVSYAHQNLIVHRDLKPSNILITTDGTPKLLDFGIAKMLNPEFSAQTASQTETAFRLMTPEYASPEQVRGEQITTASDVYSLGVLLYELLTGHRPYQIKARSSAAEIIRAVCDTAPERPSSVVSRPSPETSDSQQRTTNNEQRTKSLKGDVDNIVLTALRKEPANRYRSVEQFAEDLRRHLEGLPISARPLTFGYRAGKFVRRNRAIVAFSSFVLTLLIGFAATESFQSNRFRRERDRANVERERAEKISAFLTDIFRSADPGKAAGKELTARELLDKGAEKVRTELKDQPEAQAKLLLTIAESYQALSAFEKAGQFAEEAVNLNRELYGKDADETIKALDFLAQTRYWNKKLDEAIAVEREIITLRLEKKPDDIQIAKSQNQLAFWLGSSRRKNLAETEQSFRAALATARRVLPPDDPRLIEFLTDTASFLWEYRLKFDEAEALCRESIRLAEIRGMEKPDTLSTSYSCMGRALTAANKLPEAEPFLQKVLEIRQQMYPTPNQSVSNAMLNLANVYVTEGKFAEAEPLVQQSIEIRRRVKSVLLPFAYNTLGILRHKQGRFDEAENSFQQAIEGVPQPHVRVMNYYSEFLIDKGDLAKAEKTLRENAKRELQREGGETPLYAECLALLGKCLLRQNRTAEAADVFKKNYEIVAAAFGEDAPKTVEAQNLLRLLQK